MKKRIAVALALTIALALLACLALVISASANSEILPPAVTRATVPDCPTPTPRPTSVELSAFTAH